MFQFCADLRLVGRSNNFLFIVLKIVVTGGAGYIGSVTVDLLISLGHEVVVIDNFYTGHIEAVNRGATFVELDLAEKEKLATVFQVHRPEAVMHFASLTLVGESMEQPQRYLKENLVNGVNLIEAAVGAGTKYFILSSTANLFNDAEVMPIPADSKICPGSPYGESKFMMERALHWTHVTSGLRYACLRYFNAAGCTRIRGEDHDPETHLIPLVLQVALGQRDKIKIFGDDYDTPDGTCVRDYVHVHDLAQAHRLALEALKEEDVLKFNLGNSKGFSVMEVVETSRKITGHPIPGEITPRRLGDPATLVADSTAIQKQLGWVPKYNTLEAIIQSAWNWHRRNPKGY